MIVYVFAVQLCAFFTWSRLYCLLSSAAAVALYNFLFVDPRYSLSLIDRGYPGMADRIVVLSESSFVGNIPLPCLAADRALSGARGVSFSEVGADMPCLMPACPMRWPFCHVGMVDE